MSTKTEKMIAAKERLLDKFRRAAPRILGGGGRLPPGQHRVTKFPVLDLGIHPDFDARTWRFQVTGSVANPMDLGWEEFVHLPKTERTADFHCVTTWSQYDVTWGGVAFSEIIDRVHPAPAVTHVIQHCSDDYTTNLPLAELLRSDIMLAYELDGKPLPVEHGGPMRLVVPHLYAWKSAKFLTRLEFLDHDEPGFWEQRGYHSIGDPWKEERFG